MTLGIKKIILFSRFFKDPLGLFFFNSCAAKYILQFTHIILSCKYEWDAHTVKPCNPATKLILLADCCFDWLLGIFKLLFFTCFGSKSIIIYDALQIKHNAFKLCNKYNFFLHSKQTGPTKNRITCFHFIGAQTDDAFFSRTESDNQA